MAMTPNEMAAFFAERASKSMAALDSAKVQNVPLLLELNLRQSAQSSLMSALVDWRHRLSDPRPKLVNAFNACKTAVGLLPTLDSPTPLATRFRFYDTVFLAVLVETEPPTGCLQLLQSCRTVAESDPALDYSLAEECLGAHTITSTINAGVFSNEETLLSKTYATYSKILAGDIDEIGNAASNFSERRTDSYYYGGLHIDGGGPDNANVIDYRLAAILKARRMEVDTIHAMP